MKLYKIIIISLLAMVGSTYAIKESSKQMILDYFETKDFSNLIRVYDKLPFPTEFNSHLIILPIKELALNASASKYADILLNGASALADRMNKGESGYGSESTCILELCDLVEKLDVDEKINLDILKKTNDLKRKTVECLKRHLEWLNHERDDLLSVFMKV